MYRCPVRDTTKLSKIPLVSEASDIPAVPESETFTATSIIYRINHEHARFAVELVLLIKRLDDMLPSCEIPTKPCSREQNFRRADRTSFRESADVGLFTGRVSFGKREEESADKHELIKCLRWFVFGTPGPKVPDSPHSCVLLVAGNYALMPPVNALIIYTRRLRA